MKRMLALGLLSLNFSAEAMNVSDNKQENKTENRVAVKRFNSSIILDLFGQPKNVYVSEQKTVPILLKPLQIKLEKCVSSFPGWTPFRNLSIILPENNSAKIDNVSVPKSDSIPALTYEEKRPVVIALQELEFFLRNLLGDEVVDRSKPAVRTKRASSTSALWQKNRKIESVSEYLVLTEKLCTMFATFKMRIEPKKRELTDEYNRTIDKNRDIINQIGLLSAVKQLMQMSSRESINKEDWIAVIDAHKKSPTLEEIASKWPAVLRVESLRIALGKLLGTAIDKNTPGCDNAIWDVMEAMNKVKDLKTVFEPILTENEKPIADIVQTIVGLENRFKKEKNDLAKDSLELNELIKTIIPNKSKAIGYFRNHLNGLVCYFDEAIKRDQHDDVQIFINNWVALGKKSNRPIVHYVLSLSLPSGKSWEIHYGHVMGQNSNIGLKEKGEDQTMLLNLSNPEHVNILITCFKLLQCMAYDDLQSMIIFTEGKTPKPTAELVVSPNVNNEQNKKVMRNVILSKEASK